MEIKEIIEHCNERCNGNALLCNKGCELFLPGIFEGSCYFKFLLPAHWDERVIARKLSGSEPPRGLNLPDFWQWNWDCNFFTSPALDSLRRSLRKPRDPILWRVDVEPIIILEE